MRRRALLLALVAAACASAPDRGSRPAGDRTGDPEFEAAREAARPEFETQADALAAGIYEPFVHPDSVRPGVAARTAPAPAPRPAQETPAGEGDPSTEALLGTLSGEPWYDRPRAPRAEPGPPEAGWAGSRAETPGTEDVPIGGDAPGGRWTLQMGAYTSETGALVRIRQLERDFPDIPRWHAAAGGLWRVYLGRWADRSGADAARDAVIARGYAQAWVTRAP